MIFQDEKGYTMTYSQMEKFDPNLKNASQDLNKHIRECLGFKSTLSIIIKGFPGTGKTFVTIRLAHLIKRMIKSHINKDKGVFVYADNPLVYHMESILMDSYLNLAYINLDKIKKDISFFNQSDRINIGDILIIDETPDPKKIKTNITLEKIVDFSLENKLILIATCMYADQRPEESFDITLVTTGINYKDKINRCVYYKKKETEPIGFAYFD